MGSFMQDFKRQASFFLKEKIKTARLVLTDATPAQIMTEEITNGDSWGLDAQAMKLISKAAFEVDDYDRIVHILHQRLSKFEANNWRASYKALLLLEHLLTHGPKRVAEEFESDKDLFIDMANFHCLDDKGGMGPDSRVLVRKSRKQAEQYYRLYKGKELLPFVREAWLSDSIEKEKAQLLDSYDIVSHIGVGGPLYRQDENEEALQTISAE